MSNFILGRTKKMGEQGDEECLAEVVRAIERELTTLRAAVNAHNVFAGPSGSQLSIVYTTEQIVIPVGSGAGAGVDSLADLAPAGSDIIAFSSRVTRAPGGGATTFKAGRKAGGNDDEFAQNVACANLGETANGYADNDGTEFPILNATADKVTIITDANVTVSDMYLRVVLWYFSVTPPTS
jgi:hypothetical protein